MSCTKIPPTDLTLDPNSFLVSYSRVTGLSRSSAKISLTFPEQGQGWNQSGVLSNLYHLVHIRLLCGISERGSVVSEVTLCFLCWSAWNLLEKVNFIQQLTDRMILVGQPSTRPQDEQHKGSDPEVLKSSWRMRRASHLNYLHLKLIMHKAWLSLSEVPTCNEEWKCGQGHHLLGSIGSGRERRIDETGPLSPLGTSFPRVESQEYFQKHSVFWEGFFHPPTEGLNQVEIDHKLLGSVKKKKSKRFREELLKKPWEEREMHK